MADDVPVHAVVAYPYTHHVLWSTGNPRCFVSHAAGSGLNICSSLTAMPPICAIPFGAVTEIEASKSPGLAAVVDKAFQQRPMHLQHRHCCHLLPNICAKRFHNRVDTVDFATQVTQEVHMMDRLIGQ